MSKANPSTGDPEQQAWDRAGKMGIDKDFCPHLVNNCYPKWDDVYRIPAFKGTAAASAKRAHKRRLQRKYPHDWQQIWSDHKASCKTNTGRVLKRENANWSEVEIGSRKGDGPRVEAAKLWGLVAILREHCVWATGRPNWNFIHKTLESFKILLEGSGPLLSKGFHEWKKREMKRNPGYRAFVLETFMLAAYDAYKRGVSDGA
ncbi:MAG: hypothetical protein HY039_05180 [Nitrospirae bacterium]|nr:hypothetical protein [Nitrospirota bacterium]